MRILIVVLTTLLLSACITTAERESYSAQIKLAADIAAEEKAEARATAAEMAKACKNDTCRVAVYALYAANGGNDMRAQPVERMPTNAEVFWRGMAQTLPIVAPAAVSALQSMYNRDTTLGMYNMFENMYASGTSAVSSTATAGFNALSTVSTSAVENAGTHIDASGGSNVAIGGSTIVDDVGAIAVGNSQANGNDGVNVDGESRFQSPDYNVDVNLDLSAGDCAGSATTGAGGTASCDAGSIPVVPTAPEG